MTIKFLGLFVLVFLSSISISAQQQYVANLSGLQVVPLNNSTANGFCKLNFTPNNQFISVNITCSYSNLSSIATGVDFHAPAPVGSNGPVRFSPPGATGSRNASFSLITTINQADVDNIRANLWYFDVHSANFPDGELRGQFHLANGAYNDFDGDGRTDLTLYRSSNNTFYTRQSLNNAVREQQIGQPGDSVSLTVDFDGDGKSDFSTARYNSEVLWRILRSTTNILDEIRWGSSSLGDFFAAADYDGDGVFDIAVFRAGVWYIIESSTGNIRYEYFGQSGDVPAPNDFDKDGKADIAVARSESGQRVWYVRRSSDGVFYSIPWGLSSDSFFTGRADWDGDGAADISVIRNEGGHRVFYILRSSDFQLQVITWGLSSDVVKLGDYDGDGKTDAAVTRAVNGERVFYILQSSNSTPRYETFGLAGDF